MRKKLTDRIDDKDTGVRVQAVVALSKFQAGCDVGNVTVVKIPSV
ncbi:2257_t:CDS:2 [Paraglomus occultum]|uniref:2257_t:CDS:1 n=1 Tax=Paraglomus occultum TaxID=144539 RepID=A0A9N9G7I4_9GLOM|nr:2257_t:CDS:2 [Paraglomus occultum]